VRTERQRTILREVFALADAGTTSLAEAPLAIPAAEYLDPAVFEAERSALLRDRAVVACLSGDLPESGAFVAGTSGGVPYVVVRLPDGGLAAHANVCRHRGAPVVTEAWGSGARSFRCGFHGWVYDLDGRVVGRPHAHGGFDGMDGCDGLVPLAAAEAHGLVFVRTGGADPIDTDALLGGMGDELDEFAFGTYRTVDRWDAAWVANWKLLAATFLETYHVPALHPTTVGRHFLVAPSTFAAFGPNLRFHSLMRSVLDQRDRPEETWRLLPHGTVEYVVAPTTILNFSVDHLALYRLVPLAPERTRVELTLHVPADAPAPADPDHWRRTVDLHRRVSGGEDFTMQERVQQALGSGVLDRVVLGRNEPAAIAFHRAVVGLRGRR